MGRIIDLDSFREDKTGPAKGHIQMRSDEVDWAWARLVADFQTVAGGMGYIGEPDGAIDAAFVFFNDKRSTVLTLTKTEDGFLLCDKAGQTVWQTAADTRT